LVDDTLEIRYCCELLMTDGGALASARGSPFAAEVPRVPPASLNNELAELLRTGEMTRSAAITVRPCVKLQIVIANARRQCNTLRLLSIPLQLYVCRWKWAAWLQFS
jgi:hypothetical protein